MSVVLRTTRRVEFHETDMAGIMHFSNFFRLMEAAEVEFLRSRGLSVAFANEGRKMGFPRVAASCDFLSPARFQDLLDIEVRLENLGTKSVTYGFTISREGTPLARGKLTSVCCVVNADDRLEAIEIPAATRRKILGESV